MIVKTPVAPEMLLVMDAEVFDRVLRPYIPTQSIKETE